MKIKNITGAQIRFYRKQRGWTQHGLASNLRAMGVAISRQMIANIETQRRCVTDCQIAGIAKALQIPVVLFFSDDILADFNGALETRLPSRDIGNPPPQNRLTKSINGISGLMHRLFRRVKLSSLKQG